MSKPATMARNNAISLEVKKDGLTQRQSGDWMLRVTVAAVDMDQRIVMASMGTRYQCVLVEVGDDEMPVDHKAAERDKWRDLGPARQAGIRCKDVVFWAFLSEENAGPHIHSEEAAASLVRDICGVESRSDLAKPGRSEARLRWHDLDNAFQAWKVAENA